MRWHHHLILLQKEENCKETQAVPLVLNGIEHHPGSLRGILDPQLHAHVKDLVPSTVFQGVSGVSLYKPKVLLSIEIRLVTHYGFIFAQLQVVPQPLCSPK